MLRIEEEIQALDVVEALQGEVGVFQITDLVTNQKYILSTRPVHSLTSFRAAGNGGSPKPFLIKKTANYGEPWPGR